MNSTEVEMEMWGGIDCTINRVQDVYLDQWARSGHLKRIEQDYARFAALGFKRLRTALNWEKYDETKDWNTADTIINGLRQFDLTPILGLLHHGSGPPSTHLLDPDFPTKFAAYALRIARRYPWITDYTPINEPQTTGRFSCLYGHWFPHHRNMRSYVRALHNQIKATVLAMNAIRSVQPDARLIYTEDGGQTFAAPGLHSFHEEREHRRWLGLDLLCGTVIPGHPMFEFLRTHGLHESEIMWFVEYRCLPSVIGVNYYVTSDRFLDDRLDLYATNSIGGDTGYEPLVDTEAVRVRVDGIAGVKSILTQTWERYGLPVAITEAHLGSEPDEQIRWIVEIWKEAQEARASGVNVRAMTVWALLGLWNWSNLCTRDSGIYEPGVFDVMTQPISETSLAAVVRQMTSGTNIAHPALASEGWWRDPSRLINPEIDCSVPLEELQPA